MIIHSFQGGFDKNLSYLIWCDITKNAAIVDPAVDSTPIFEAVEQHNLILEKILITHSHYDHISYIDDYIYRVPEIAIYCNEQSTKLFKSSNIKGIDEYEKKIPGFKDVIQIQLITSKGKPPVYFVTSENDKKYVLKGPMKMEMRNQIMKTENLKKVIGLNHLNVEFINICDQNWMKSDSLLEIFQYFITNSCNTTLRYLKRV